LSLIRVCGPQVARDKGLNCDLVSGYGRTIREVADALQGTTPPTDKRTKGGAFTGFELRGGVEIVPLEEIAGTEEDRGQVAAAAAHLREDLARQGPAPVPAPSPIAAPAAPAVQVINRVGQGDVPSPSGRGSEGQQQGQATRRRRDEEGGEEGEEADAVMEEESEEEGTEDEMEREGTAGAADVVRSTEPATVGVTAAVGGGYRAVRYVADRTMYFSECFFLPFTCTLLKKAQYIITYMQVF
jgi:hypothetical protein